jgi:phosphotransferase system  glucose/maltose/N-acetylglucosamine-specific IIC component
MFFLLWYALLFVPLWRFYAPASYGRKVTNMATTNTLYRPYSMEYGTFVGLSWGALFLSYAKGICDGNSFLIFLCLILCGVSFFLPFVLAMRLNRKLHLIGERLSYWQGLLFSFPMFMYACLMSSLIIFAYFQFFDNGMLLEQLIEMMTQAEIVETYRQLGMTEQYKQMVDIVHEVDFLSPLDKTLALFNNNFFFSAIMSFLVAGVASVKLRKS